MATLTNSVKQKLEHLLGMQTGYVLDFSDASFHDFIQTSGNIDAAKGRPAGESKAWRLRRLWQEEDDQTVAKLMLDMLERWRTNKLMSDSPITGNKQLLYEELVGAMKLLAANSSSGSSRPTLTQEPTEATKQAPAPQITIETLHPKILAASRSLFVSNHYPSAILEAYKAVFNEIKQLTGIRNLDGKKLAEKVFAIENPVIQLNALETESEQDEQKGFMLLLSGAAVGIRNPKAHDLVDQKDPQRALEYLSFASLLLTRIDERVGINLKVLQGSGSKPSVPIKSKSTAISIDPPYVYIKCTFGGNGVNLRLAACETFNLSDHFVFLDHIKIFGRTINFDDSLVKAGDSLRHTGIDDLEYPSSDKDQYLDIIFHSKNAQRFVARQKLKLQQRQDGKFNVIGLSNPSINAL